MKRSQALMKDLARRLLLAETIDRKTILSDARGKACKVAITRNEAKAPQFPRVQQIHCVDDERAVTGILTDCITELLDGLDRMFEQHCAPAMQVCCRE